MTFPHKARCNHGTNGKTISGGGNQDFVYHHISTFAITILPTLDVKKIQNTHKKPVCPHKLGYSDI